MANSDSGGIAKMSVSTLTKTPVLHSESTMISRRTPNTQVEAPARLQFSMSALMLGVLAVAVVCAAIRSLGYIWIVPLILAGLAATNFVMAVRGWSNWRILKLSYWHLVVWLALAAAASGFAVYACLDYNSIAGTDKTPGHIVQISAAALAGPMIGPVANSAAGETPEAWRWTAILLAVQLLVVSPFLFVRRIVPLVVSMICWMGFVSGSVLWFFGAMISLGIFLS